MDNSSMDPNVSSPSNTNSAAPTYTTQLSESSQTGVNSAIKDKRHFKKSMIFEYEKIESGGSVSGLHHHLHQNDDSQSSSSCASFGGSPLMSRPTQPQLQQQPKMSLSSRLDEIRPSKLSMSIDIVVPPPPLPSIPSSSSTLPSFNQQLNTLNTMKSDPDGSFSVKSEQQAEKTLMAGTSKSMDVLDTDESSYQDGSSNQNQKKRKKEVSESKSELKSQSKKSKSSNEHRTSSGKSKNDDGGKKKTTTPVKKTPQSSTKKTTTTVTTTKRKDEENKVLYCICREEASKRFMM